MQNWRIWLLFYLMIAMMASVFLSRFALSVTMIVFFAAAFAHTGWAQQFRKFIRTPLLWSMSLLLLLPLISGLWSADKKQWIDIVQIKLPLLAFPLAFAGPMNFSQKQWDRLAYLFIAIVAIACGWSLYYYINDAEAINEGYLSARSLITPLQNDHVRFSWLVNIAIILSAWYYFKGRKVQAGSAIIFFLIATGFIIFLHILAARTGLIAFYISLLLLSWFSLKRISAKFAIGFLILLISLPLIAYALVPSFRNRVKYLKYDFGFFKHAGYHPSTTDAVRIISMNAGGEIMLQHPMCGVGFGDIHHETEEWYNKEYPTMLNEDKILPSSEWLIYGAACGIAGLLIFTIPMIIPLFTRVQEKLLWSILIVTSAFSFLADIGLEVQFGIFLYAFIVLWWWKWFTAQNV